MNILLNQSVFLFTVAGLFFLPGALFLAAFFRKRLPKLSFFEYALFSFAISLSLLDFGMLILSKLSLPLSRISLLGLEAILVSIPLFFLLPLLWKKWRYRKDSAKSASHETLIHGIGFSQKEGLLFMGILILTLLFKSVFLWSAILPTATDMGHHMFWSKKIAVEGIVPAYAKINIVSDENGESSLTEPQPIADFIVGEHLPFAAISLVTGLDFVSAFPSLFLLLVNVLTVLALSLLAYRLFEDIFPTQTLARRGMIAVLLFIGPLWALSSPEAKYVSGGVIGNLLGNFLIPIILLAFFRAIREKNVALLGLAILFAGTLAFTHHLSTLVFLFIVIFVCVAFLLLARKESFSDLRSWFRLFLQPFPLAIIFSLLAITLFVYTPTYFHGSAIDTAIGAPSKESRAGLTFDQLAKSVGGARLGLELVGIALLLISPLRKTLGGALLLAWSAGLILMTLFPGVLFINIPSNRISTYGSFPAAILAGFALVSLFKNKSTYVENTKTSGGEHLFQWSFALFLVATIVGGFFDNASSLPAKSNAGDATQTYAVSSWLARNTGPNEWILKDHNYLTADSWMKLFFMRDYSYPLSRGAFQRYNDDTKPREQCTLLMISAPNTTKGKACFDGTGTSMVVVNPHVDSAQFSKDANMSLVYASDDIAVYKQVDIK